MQPILSLEYWKSSNGTISPDNCSHPLSLFSAILCTTQYVLWKREYIQIGVWVLDDKMCFLCLHAIRRRLTLDRLQRGCVFFIRQHINRPLRRRNLHNRSDCRRLSISLWIVCRQVSKATRRSASSSIEKQNVDFGFRVIALLQAKRNRHHGWFVCTFNLAMRPASFVACLWKSLKCAGTAITTSMTVHPRYASTISFKLTIIIVEISSGTNHSVPFFDSFKNFDIFDNFESSESFDSFDNFESFNSFDSFDLDLKSLTCSFFILHIRHTDCSSLWRSNTKR